MTLQMRTKTGLQSRIPQLGRSLQRSGQDGRGGENVRAGAGWKGESMGPRAYIDTRHRQQLGPSLYRPGQAGRGGEDVPTGNELKSKD